MNIPNRLIKLMEKKYQGKIISTIDSHTAGDTTRIVVNGLPEIPGKTMVDKKNWLQEKGSFYRHLLMREPRGFSDMEGIILTKPAQKDADIGAVFMSPKYFWDMCGTGIIGLTVTLFEIGYFDPEKRSEIYIDTPAGIITSIPKFINGRIKEVSFLNVPSFYHQSYKIDLPMLAQITLDIAYGGGFYGIVSLKSLNLDYIKDNITQYIQIAQLIIATLKKNFQIEYFQHPSGAIEPVDSLTIRMIQENDDRDFVVTVPPEKTIYRSPCGTGSCAHLAWKFHYGKIKENQTLIHQSLIETELKTKIVKILLQNGKQVIIPQVTGSAWITGFHQFVLQSGDPVTEGFEI